MRMRMWHGQQLHLDHSPSLLLRRLGRKRRRLLLLLIPCGRGAPRPFSLSGLFPRYLFRAISRLSHILPHRNSLAFLSPVAKSAFFTFLINFVNTVSIYNQSARHKNTTSCLFHNIAVIQPYVFNAFSFRIFARLNCYIIFLRVVSSADIGFKICISRIYFHQ